MNRDGWAEYLARYKARWQRWEAERKAARESMATWKPVMSDQEKQAHDQYVIEHNLPF
jgi:hypothetical protein